MNVLHNVVRVHIPGLLASVPIPDSFTGLFSLSPKDILGLTLFSGFSAAIGYSIYFTVKNRGFSKQFNTEIKKDQEKVVDFVDIESINGKASFCRCWKSKKFPYCDGAHNSYNKETGDNIGPLVIEAKKTN
ncbi:unnamed protein product [Rodentolepis nana]|uniref:CDGSH iron-sulfur domain-containing protein 2 homologue n=1 Tax=Rodentolepis nana TaxID=102285 RepID=A0A0R3T5D5_RODNA|nr:unnamed protein product [Rodentolepis nana]